MITREINSKKNKIKIFYYVGTAWGYVESFLFWFLQDLGGSRSLMGITITVGGIAGIPLLVLSGPIIKKIGHANVLFIGFVFHAIRLLGNLLSLSTAMKFITQLRKVKFYLPASQYHKT